MARYIEDEVLLDEECLKQCQAALRHGGKFAKEASDLAVAYESLVQKLADEFYTAENSPDGIEWADTEAETAIKGYLFWWTWGN